MMEKNESRFGLLEWAPSSLGLQEQNFPGMWALMASPAIHPNAEDDELLKMQVVVNVNFTQAQLPSDVVRLCGKRGGCNL